MKKMYLGYSKTYGAVMKPTEDRTAVEDKVKNFVAANQYTDVGIYELVSYAKAPVAAIELIAVTA